MERRTLGTTGLSISRLGVGCGPGARLFTDGSAREVDAVLGAALDAGIDYFDTAANYADGLSETNLAAGLKRLGAKPVVATKIKLDFDQLDGIKDAVISSVEGSLRRLGRSCLDLVFLHNRIGAARAVRPDVGSGALLTVEDVMGEQGVAEAFADLSRRGLVRNSGCCVFGGAMGPARTVLESGAFSAVILNYSMLNPSAWRPGCPKGIQPNYAGVGAAAVSAGMGIVGLRILEGGTLTGLAGAAHGSSRFDFLLGEGEDRASLALRFAMAQRGIDNLLIGLSDVGQLRSALSAMKRGPIGNGEMRAILANWEARPAG